MRNENLPWEKAAVLICTKCGKSIPGAPADLGEQLKNEMKMEVKNQGLAEQIRVMTSSCLNICEEGSQAVAFLPAKNAGQAVIKVLNPMEEKDVLKKEILNLKNLIS